MSGGRSRSMRRKRGRNLTQRTHPPTRAKNRNTADHSFDMQSGARKGEGENEYRTTRQEFQHVANFSGEGRGEARSQREKK